MRGSEMPLLSVRDAARLLGVHENTIRNWCNTGMLMFERLPGNSGYRRIPVSEVNRLLGESMAKSAGRHDL